MKAIITGINGQDGGYLAEILVNNGYEVIGTTRKCSRGFDKTDLSIDDKSVSLVELDIIDSSAIDTLLGDCKPDEFYNLAGFSHVGQSFKQPYFCYQTNAVAVNSILDSIKRHSPKTKFLNCSSIEQFGRCHNKPITESCSMTPVSPYGISKAAAFQITKMFRESYGIFANSLILTNHESPRRPSTFVVKKIIKESLRISREIKNNLSPDPLRLGSLSVKKDWIHSKDAVNAMFLSMQQNISDDYLIGSGSLVSIEDLCQKAFSLSGINIVFSGNGKDRIGKVGKLTVVVIDPLLARPSEPNPVLIDKSKAKVNLGWELLYNFEEMVNDIYRHENSTYTNEIYYA